MPSLSDVDVEDVVKLAHRCLTMTEYKVENIQWWEGQALAVKVLDQLGRLPEKYVGPPRLI